MMAADDDLDPRDLALDRTANPIDQGNPARGWRIVETLDGVAGDAARPAAARRGGRGDLATPGLCHAGPTTHRIVWWIRDRRRRFRCDVVTLRLCDSRWARGGLARRLLERGGPCSCLCLRYFLGNGLRRRARAETRVLAGRRLGRRRLANRGLVGRCPRCRCFGCRSPGFLAGRPFARRLSIGFGRIRRGRGIARLGTYGGRLACGGRGMGPDSGRRAGGRRDGGWP